MFFFFSTIKACLFLSIKPVNQSHVKGRNCLLSIFWHSSTCTVSKTCSLLMYPASFIIGENVAAFCYFPHFTDTPQFFSAGYVSQFVCIEKHVWSCSRIWPLLKRSFITNFQQDCLQIQKGNEKVKTMKIRDHIFATSAGRFCCPCVIPFVRTTPACYVCPWGGSALSTEI